MYVIDAKKTFDLVRRGDSWRELKIKSNKQKGIEDKNEESKQFITKIGVK